MELIELCLFALRWILFIFVYRDTRDYKSRIEAYSREMLRKEAQIKDLQSRIDNGDGSK